LIDLTLSQGIMRGCAVLVVSTLQGAAMAAFAGALGDEGPRHDGRVTLDPFRHLDIVGGLTALIFLAGWAKWVVINPRELRGGRIGLVFVVIAGLAAVIAGALALRLVRPFLLPLLPYTAAATAFELIEVTIELAVSFAVLGLLPIPPLAAGQLIIAAFPKLGDAIARVELVLSLIIAVVVATGILDWAINPAYAALLSLVLGRHVQF
jgi:hypothetical protein